MQPVTALTIAGSDSGGGAGIQADLRTFSAFRVHGTSAITAVTAQNTLRVDDVVVIDPDSVESQVRSVVDDFEVRATKTGMLATPRTVERVASLARDGIITRLVVDPVLVSSTGHALMSDGGPRAYRDDLFPVAEIVTPNLREASLLCGVDERDVRSRKDVLALGRQLLSMGPRYVLVKGGHFADRVPPLDEAPDVLLGDEGSVVFDAPRVDTKNDHGTGCSLSSAIAAGLALGQSVPDAVAGAKQFVFTALERAAHWRLGAGRGPIDHLGWGP